MRVTEFDSHISMIDVETAGIKGFVASYVVRGKRVALIETGPASSVSNLLTGLEEIDVKPEDVVYVAVSHVHLDHGGGVGTLLKHLPIARVVVHQRGAPHLANPEKLWQQSQEVLGGITELYGAPEPVPEDKIISATDGMTFDIGDNVKLRAIETLGHASHHLSYYEPLGQGIFTGDAAGIYLSEADVLVPTTPPPFRLDIALASLNKLAGLKPRTLYYSHFGKTNNATGQLRAYERQLKLWAAIAQQSLARKENLATISKRIREEDPAIRKALEHIRAHAILGETVLNESVQGIVGFVEKYGDVSC